MFPTIVPRLQAWALMALAVILVLFGAYAYGSRRAKRAEEIKSEAERLRKDLAIEKGNTAAKDTAIEAAMVRRDAEVAAATLSPGQAQAALRDEWSRD